MLCVCVCVKPLYTHWDPFECCWFIRSIIWLLLVFVTEKKRNLKRLFNFVFISLWHICNYYWLHCFYAAGYAGCLFHISIFHLFWQQHAFGMFGEWSPSSKMECNQPSYSPYYFCRKLTKLIYMWLIKYVASLSCVRTYGIKIFLKCSLPFN